MRLLYRLVIGGITIFLSVSCTELETFPILNAETKSTLFIAHRGGESNFMNNTFEASRVGLASLDGIELDIQISKDGTLWIAHDKETPTCGTLKSECFATLTDKEIENYNKCSSPKIDIDKLEDVLKFVALNHPTSKISLDVKPWFPCSLNSLSVFKELSKIADQINILSLKYNLSDNIFVESEHICFLQYLKKLNPLIECHILAFSDLEKAGVKALKNGLNGVSFKFTANEIFNIKQLQQRGLTIQLWTINSQSDINKALKLGPNYIQTDRLDVKNIFQSESHY